MSSMAGQESSSERQRRFAQRKPSINPAIVGSGGRDMVSVAVIAYSAQRHGQDTEQCIKEAVEAGEIELAHKDADRSYDTYRLTARGRELHRMHMKNVERIREECMGPPRKAASGEGASGQALPPGGRSAS